MNISVENPGMLLCQFQRIFRHLGSVVSYENLHFILLPCVHIWKVLLECIKLPHTCQDKHKMGSGFTVQG